MAIQSCYHKTAKETQQQIQVFFFMIYLLYCRVVAPHPLLMNMMSTKKIIPTTHFSFLFTVP